MTEVALSTKIPKRNVVEESIKRLLQKAGTDPRVTPRLLREKAEQRLKLALHTLKPMREDIKNMIMEWHQERMEKLGQDIKLLVKLTKASGIDASIYADLREMDDRETMKRLFTER